MKIVHLALDEKFLPLARSLFDEAFPGANTFLVCRRRGQTPRFLRPDAQVHYRRSLRFRHPWLMPELRRADIVVVHAMTGLHAGALRAVPASALVVWIGYGFDYYDLLGPRIGGLWGEATGALVRQLALGDGAAASPQRTPLADVAARIDVFSVNPAETEMLREALPALRARYHALPSFTLEDVFEQGPPHMAGPDVLLGNSAAPTNNHLEAFELLAGALPPDARLVVPLSYGCSDPRYADHIEAAGRQRFGERFVPLRHWMPLAEYQNCLARCGSVLMNHRRQQAVGNLAASLHKGARVFLPRGNPLFTFFTGLGASVTPVEAIATDPALLCRPLDAATQSANRAAIAARFGRAAVLARVRALEALHRERAILP